MQVNMLYLDYNKMSGRHTYSFFYIYIRSFQTVLINGELIHVIFRFSDFGLCRKPAYYV